MGQTVTERSRRGTVGRGFTTTGRTSKRRAQTNLHERVAASCVGPWAGKSTPCSQRVRDQPGCAGYPDGVGAPTDPDGFSVETTRAQLKGVDAGKDRPNMPRDRTPQGWCMSAAPAAGTGHLHGRGRSPGSSVDAVQNAGTPVGEGLARRRDRRTAAGLSCSRASASRYSCSATDHHPCRSREQWSPLPG